jgi:electron transfer flavoprotein alpha subunit
VATDLAASLAVALDCGVAWDLHDVRHSPDGPIGIRLALDDAVSVEVGWLGRPAIGIVRLGQLEAAPPVAGPDPEGMPVAEDAAPRTVRIVERTRAHIEGADLQTADVIVAGGRGLRDRESLVLLDDLAAALGGVVAVSMPLVDRGWMPHSRQVGQTGNKVRPRLYVACGISGQLAHRVGMEKSRVIVAINADATAPIFGICDVGLVGDLHSIVPELARRIREARSTAS